MAWRQQGAFLTVGEPAKGHEEQEASRYQEARANSEATWDGQLAVLVDHSTDGLRFCLESGRRGTETQGTRCREGETGHDALLEGKMSDTLRSQAISTKLQWIAEQVS